MTDTLYTSGAKRRVLPEKRREYNLRMAARYPERMEARWRCRDAIKSGKLVRQPCEKCGEPKTDAHHDDYSKPLEVRWLCRAHHAEHHRGRKNRPATQPRQRIAAVACKRGHAFTPENTSIDVNGKRKCRFCINWRARRNRKA